MENGLAKCAFDSRLVLLSPYDCAFCTLQLPHLKICLFTIITKPKFLNQVLETGRHDINLVKVLITAITYNGSAVK